MAPIVHVVLFSFKSSATLANIAEVCEEVLALPGKCIHPITLKQYVKGTGGRDVSPEGLQRGMTHGFVLEFESEEDREYYVHRDPAHVAFVKRLKELGVLERDLVVDFVRGKL
ncbi:stress responsive A/B barrel domain-containing protein [Geopyxis carbonaria]|nr:stress responsive A/B barrel domain-containing protein [Geopyxis carbonaria]